MQTKGTTTNMKKLSSWDIDFYESLSDDEDCILFLSEKELYLLRNPLRQMKWSTRWTSELQTSMPDISTIAENLDYKMSGDACMDFCQMIIDCIDDEESGVGARIAELVATITEDTLRETAQSYNNVPLAVNFNPTCDKDILFGQCTQLVEYLHQQNLEFLRVLEVVTNIAEQVATIIGAISGAKGQTVSAVVEWITFVQNSIAENYEAQVTLAYKEECACALFCLAQQNSCIIDPAEIYRVWRERLVSAVTIDSLFNETVDFLVAGVWTGTEIADVMFFAQLAFRSQIGQYIEAIAYSDIDIRLAVYSNDPDPDWVILCDECPVEWTYEQDWLASRDGWEFFPVGGFGAQVGTWIITEGFISTNAQVNTTQYQRGTYIEYDFDDVTQVNRIALIYDLVKGSFSVSGTSGCVFIQGRSGGRTGTLLINEQVTINDAVNGDDQLFEWNGEEDIDFILLAVRSSQSDPAPSYSGSSKLVSLEVVGEGDNPFI